MIGPAAAPHLWIDLQQVPIAVAGRRDLPGIDGQRFAVQVLQSAAALAVAGIPQQAQRGPWRLWLGEPPQRLTSPQTTLQLGAERAVADHHHGAGELEGYGAEAEQQGFPTATNRSLATVRKVAAASGSMADRSVCWRCGQCRSPIRSRLERCRDVGGVPACRSARICADTLRQSSARASQP